MLPVSCGLLVIDKNQHCGSQKFEYHWHLEIKIVSSLNYFFVNIDLLIITTIQSMCLRPNFKF